MGIYTHEYSTTEEYHKLISSQSLGEGQHTRRRRLSDCGPLLRPSFTASTTLKSPALRFIHTLLSGTITGWIRGTNFINFSEFKCLLSMGNGTPYHLGFFIINSFHHQATNTRGHTIFTGPYLTQLIVGMGLLGDMDHIPTIGGYNPIFVRSLHSMGFFSLLHSSHVATLSTVVSPTSVPASSTVPLLMTGHSHLS